MAKKEAQSGSGAAAAAEAAAAPELTAEEKLAAAEQRIAEAEAKAAEAEAKAAEAKTGEAEVKDGGKLPKIIKTSDPKEADKYHKQGYVVRKHGSGRNAAYVVYTTQQVLDGVKYVQQEVDARLKGIGSKG